MSVSFAFLIFNLSNTNCAKFNNSFEALGFDYFNTSTRIWAFLGISWYEFMSYIWENLAVQLLYNI
jgi:hypothetical protein